MRLLLIICLVLGLDARGFLIVADVDKFCKYYRSNIEIIRVLGEPTIKVKGNSLEILDMLNRNEVDIALVEESVYKSSEKNNSEVIGKIVDSNSSIKIYLIVNRFLKRSLKERLIANMDKFKIR